MLVSLLPFLPLLHFSMGCSSPSVEYINQTLEPFTLLDVNSTSIFFDTEVSSNQFASESPELVSAWYFGHST